MAPIQSKKTNEKYYYLISIEIEPAFICQEPDYFKSKFMINNN